jgi:hypothetical protein
MGKSNSGSLDDACSRSAAYVRRGRSGEIVVLTLDSSVTVPIVRLPISQDGRKLTTTTITDIFDANGVLIATRCTDGTRTRVEELPLAPAALRAPAGCGSTGDPSRSDVGNVGGDPDGPLPVPTGQGVGRRR